MGTHRKSSTHSNNLDRLFQTQQLGRHDLQKVSAMLIVNHVKLIEHHRFQGRYGAIIDCRVD